MAIPAQQQPAQVPNNQPPAASAISDIAIPGYTEGKVDNSSNRTKVTVHKEFKGQQYMIEVTFKGRLGPDQIQEFFGKPKTTEQINTNLKQMDFFVANFSGKGNLHLVSESGRTVFKYDTAKKKTGKELNLTTQADWERSFGARIQKYQNKLNDPHLDPALREKYAAKQTKYEDIGRRFAQLMQPIANNPAPQALSPDAVIRIQPEPQNVRPPEDPYEL